MTIPRPVCRYAFQLSHRTLQGDGDTSRGDEPQPPEDPIVREYDVGLRSNAPAIEVAPAPCDVTSLDDDTLRDLGEHVQVELERRDI